MLGLGYDWGRGVENGMNGKKPLPDIVPGGVENRAVCIRALGDK